MKTKTILFSSILSPFLACNSLALSEPLSVVTYDSSCGIWPRFSTGPGNKTKGYLGGDAGIMFLPNFTAYTVGVDGGSGASPCFRIRVLKIIKDNVLLIKADTNILGYFVSLNSFPGSYKVCVNFDAMYMGPIYCEWTYKILENPTSVLEKKNSDASGMSVYPNPAGSLVHIESGKTISNIGVFDLNGKEFLRFEVGSPIADLPIGTLPEGVYVMQVGLESQRIVIKKLIVERD